ncbi:MAG: hypothetical protein CVU11_11520 [Bacteroidetes bacterium HGW-Bacteroidetes-6]|jgi:hypothetical protein|nr:MAG: hypothetical protein CVU11_11520 [Bacteroidetes bacterium HGW-Bacteroidetes-6]
MGNLVLKTFISFLILVLLDIPESKAQTATPDETKTVAIQFARQRLNNNFTPYFLDTYQVNFQNIPVYYVYNLFPEGYVIVSAEKSTIPVIAYSPTGICPQQSNNPAFDWWMNQYAQQIYLAKKSKPRADNPNTTIWKNYITGNIPATKSQVGPLLTSTWNQEVYYNEFCPADDNGPDDKCLTGCVATAIGQLMNYYRWPVSGTGSYTSEDLVYGPLTVDYAAANYNYNEMATKLTRSNPETAELIYNIGVSVDMHYGPYGSGMNNHKAAYCMKTFFKYVDSTEYIFRDSVTINWDSVVVSHLNRLMPMYYAGWSDTNYVSGHAFVVDGYQDSSYFHFNWGWGGSFDGYFYTSALTPGGANFTLMHELVINMYPEGAYPLYCSGTDTLHSDDGTIDDGSGPIFGYRNNSNCSWLIEPNDSVQAIQLNFLRFETESGNDVLTVYNGHNSSAPVLGSFSGSSLPASVQSTGNALFLTFSSNGSDSAAGFLVAYKTISPSFCTSLTTLNAESDTISDGSGIFDYHGNSFCRWKIQPTSGLPVLLAFTEFDLDSTDYVSVIDHSDGTQLGEFRGNQLPPVLFSPNGTITLLLKTTATAHAGGFTCNYRTSQTPVIDINNPEPVLYPNPTTDYINITGLGVFSEVHIFNSTGSCVHNCNYYPVNRNLLLPVAGLQEGLYFVTITNENSQQHVLKFVKQDNR